MHAHGELIFGMEEDRLILMDKLIDGLIPELLVIVILYMVVADYFHVRAWATVGMKFWATEILEDIVSWTWGMSTYEIVRLGTMELMEMLYKSQKVRRYLDDVWSKEVWNTLKIAFPLDHNRSKIVITTLLMDVAHYSGVYIHKMELLNEEQSWELFKLKFSGKRDQDQAMPVEKLYVLWMAEGLIIMSYPSYKRQMQDAEEYLRELAYRSLVLVPEMEPVLYSIKIRSCQLHDLIQLSDLKGFQRTRVLDFGKVDFRIGKLPKGINKVTYLTYFSFRGCYLPEFLAFLISCAMTIPNVMWKLSNLKHLYFPLACRSDTNEKLKLDSLKKLQVLENFPTGICDIDDLRELKNLENSKGFVDVNNKRRSIMARLLECNATHNLNIEGYPGMFPHLDKGIGSNFTEMNFNRFEFSEDPMPILGMLPNLRSLVLCNDAFLGKKMRCLEDGFPLLRSLELEVGAGSIPVLNIYIVEKCDKLETLRCELTKIPTLQKLMIGLMPIEFHDEVKKLVEEQRTNWEAYDLTTAFYDCG
ncbi:hypothetical protein CDL12_08240 [Handroanthus impetiginosus]|uniref:Uncharacterized protein n=1 Tax=Handroanthus impetiginosus TaxID=429701 RepID=A0A2G9HNI3_9LAMI|nr:hypothetical protein CDL12_08240 [Handroanthus impetiginosus]